MLREFKSLNKWCDCPCCRGKLDKNGFPKDKNSKHGFDKKLEKVPILRLTIKPHKEWLVTLKYQLTLTTHSLPMFSRMWVNPWDAKVRCGKFIPKMPGASSGLDTNEQKTLDLCNACWSSCSYYLNSAKLCSSHKLQVHKQSSLLAVMCLIQCFKINRMQNVEMNLHVGFVEKKKTDVKIRSRWRLKRLSWWLSNEVPMP